MTVDSNAVRASSAIIGLVLLVGLTVLLSAVVAVLALDMIQDQPDDLQPWDENAPDATFDIDRLGDDVIVTHSGESVSASALEIRGDLETDPASFDGQTVDDGDSVMLALETSANATVRVVWTTAYGEDVLTEAVV